MKSINYWQLGWVGLFALLVSIPLHAQIVHDGSIGKAATLSAPNYLIDAQNGQQLGGNLFHSFSQFNVKAGESATFAGPANVQNIISRVTGGQVSNLNGRLVSQIANANVYLLNPAGVLLGAGFQLDITGSFHVSSADYLKLQDGVQFSVDLGSASTLSVAAPAAFGFLGTTAGNVQVTGTAQQKATVRVATGKTLTLAGGNVNLQQATLESAAGQVNVVATQGKTEVALDKLADAPLAGQVQMQAAQVTTQAGGSVLIRGGEVIINDSTVDARTLTRANAGRVDIRGNNVTVSNGAQIDGATEAQGRGADIRLQATNNLTLTGENATRTTTVFANAGTVLRNTDDIGDAGKVELNAKNVTLSGGAAILASATGGGDAGDVNIQADSVNLTGASRSGLSTTISASTLNHSTQAGRAGNVNIQANNIALNQGAAISSQTAGSGKGGEVTLQAKENITLQGESSGGNPSRIVTLTSSQRATAGQGGSLQMEAKNIRFSNGAGLDASTRGRGNAGNVRLKAEQDIEMKGLKNDGDSGYLRAEAGLGSTGGNGGELQMEARNITLTDGNSVVTNAFGIGKGGNVTVKASGTVTLAGANELGYVSAMSSGSNPQSPEIPAGDSGNVSVTAQELILKDGGLLATNTSAAEGRRSGQAGNVQVQVTGATTISGVNPYGENEDGFASGIYTRTRGSGNNAGRAGDIQLDTGTLTLADGAVIVSSTNNEAVAGNITVNARESVQISGDASQIALNEAADSQLAYVSNFNPSRYNQSTSGIYSASESIDSKGGNSGTLTVNTANFKMSQKGTLSTASQGGGKAGDITVRAETFDIDSSAAITSDSQAKNAYLVNTVAERDSQFVRLGDSVEVKDIGAGKSGYYVNTGSQLIRYSNTYQVATPAQLTALQQRVALVNGEIVEVARDTDGNPARYVFANDDAFRASSWVKLGSLDTPSLTVSSFGQLTSLLATFRAGTTPTQANGSVIRVSDMGDGRNATFVYVHLPISGGRIRGHVVPINQFSVANTTALLQLPRQTNLNNGTVATIRNADGTVSRFVYQNNVWTRFNREISVANLAAQNKLILAQDGMIAKNPADPRGRTTGFIYEGRGWLPLGTIYEAANLTERGALTAARAGDVVKVADAGNGKAQNYVFSGTRWTPFMTTGEAGTIKVDAQFMNINDKATITTTSQGLGKAGSVQVNAELLALNRGGNIASRSLSPALGGNAGVIDVNIQKDTRLSENSSITTEALSAGGGQITYRGEKEIYLRDSRITTSVLDGRGNGGDLNASPDFIVQDNSLIIARAFEGRGGNINIQTNGIYVFEPKSTSSIDASSELGIDGIVVISSPDSNTSGFLALLASDFENRPDLQANPCTAAAAANASKFVVLEREGVPTYGQDDYQPSGTRLASQTVSTPAAVSLENAPASGRMLLVAAAKTGFECNVD